MLDRSLKNNKGFTLIELLIAMTIGIVVLGSTVYIYSKQDRLLRNENKNVQMRDFARLAMDELGANIRLAGYGFPPGDSVTGRPARGLTAATATSLTFMANTDNISTYASFDSTDPNNTGLVVANTTSFAFDDKVVFFDVEKPAKWNTKTYTSQATIPGVGEFMGWGTGSPARNVTPGVDGGGGDGKFLPVTDNVAVEVNKYHTITYTYNAGAQTITLTDDRGTASNGDDVTTTIATNISNLTFSYFAADGTALTTLPLSAADLGNVRRVQVSVTVVDPNDNTMTTTLLTDYHLRNMGI